MTKPALPQTGGSFVREKGELKPNAPAVQKADPKAHAKTQATAPIPTDKKEG